MARLKSPAALAATVPLFLAPAATRADVIKLLQTAAYDRTLASQASPRSQVLLTIW